MERREKDTWEPLGSSQAAFRVGPLASQLLLLVASSNGHKQSSCRPPQLSFTSAHGPPFFPPPPARRLPPFFSGVQRHTQLPSRLDQPNPGALAFSVPRGASFARSPRHARRLRRCRLSVRPKPWKCRKKELREKIGAGGDARRSSGSRRAGLLKLGGERETGRAIEGRPEFKAARFAKDLKAKLGWGRIFRLGIGDCLTFLGNEAHLLSCPASAMRPFYRTE